MECKTSGKPGASFSAGKYVLVVGNDATNRVYTSLLLQKLNYHICSASNAEEALEMVKAILPTLIISDLKLAGMSAPQMIQALKQDSRTAGIPVIFKLEKVNANIEQKCREAGAVACIRKPVEPEELYRVVQAVIEPTPRGHIRIRTRLSVTLNHVPLDVASGECATVLSSRGMFIQTQRPFPVQAKFPVQVKLNRSLIHVEAKVVYSYAVGEGPFGVPGMGLYFTEIEPKDEKRLQEFINHEVTKGIVPNKK